MSLRPNHVKLIGAAGAAALTVGALAAPALAAGELTATVNYSCGTPLGPATPSAAYAVNQPPATIVAGQLVRLGTTATFTLDAGTTLLAQGLGWTKFNGKLTTPAGLPKVGLNISIPKTTLGNGPLGTTVANASGKTLLKARAAGTMTLKLGHIGHVTLRGFDADGNSVGDPVNFPSSDGNFGRCMNVDTTTPLKNASAENATVKVLKDSSKTIASASYSASTDVAKGKAKVKGATYGLPGTGKVKFILKKGTHVLKTTSSKLNKRGIAKVAFNNVKKHGKYSITAKFGGDAALKASSDKATFTV